MKLANIPSKEAISLLRSLSLLIGQAGIYGPSHNVTQNAARAMFPVLQQAVNQHGTVEIAQRDRKMLVNGAVLDVGGSSGKNLLDRMALHKIEGIAFLPPANMDEFLKCVALFGAPPLSLAASGGLENAMKRANLRSIQVVSVTYQRMPKDQATTAKADPGRPDKPRAPWRPGATEVLDLASVQEIVPDDTAAPGGTPPDAAFEEASKQTWIARQQRASALAGLLRQAATMLEQENAAGIDNRHEALEGAFSQLRDMLAKMTTESERQINTFAGQVHADREAIADIESAARRRGIGLQLTRSELISHYAEISQEIAQPLTVSTGVLDLLNSGRAGDLSESQRTLLKMAAESVERVNRLVAHLKQISGMPGSLTPDAAILKDAYKK